MTVILIKKSTCWAMDAALVMSSYDEFVQLNTMMSKINTITLHNYLPINPTLRFSGHPFFFTASGNSLSV